MFSNVKMSLYQVTVKMNMSLFYNVSNVSLILYIVGKQVYQWYMGRRTVYGKLTTDNSGDGAKVCTDREQWTLDKFQFIKATSPGLQGAILLV